MIDTGKKKESVHWVNTLMLLPKGTIYLGTPKHDTVVKVLEQVYHVDLAMSSVIPPAGRLSSLPSRRMG